MAAAEPVGRSRENGSGFWQDAADVMVVGLRKTLDYQRAVADDYRDRFLDQPRGRSDESPADWSQYTSGMADYASSVFELTIDYYRELADAAGRYVETSYPDFVGGRPSTKYYGSGGRAPERALLQIHGAVGELVTARFSVENSDDEPAEVFVEAGVCRSAGGHSFDPILHLTPNAILLAPHDAVTVKAQLELDPAHFEHGTVYRIPVKVHGPDPAVIDLEVSVAALATAPAKQIAPEPPASAPLDKAPLDASYKVQCPSCHRVFERTTPNLKLRPHGDGDGSPCLERHGNSVG